MKQYKLRVYDNIKYINTSEEAFDLLPPNKEGISDWVLDSWKMSEPQAVSKKDFTHSKTTIIAIWSKEA